MNTENRYWKSFVENWQKILFAAFGFVPLYYSITFLVGGKVTEAGGAFGIAFLSFLYSNLSQFKRIKGLGFEAERWEDKQKEAEALIDRLKNVVAIYSSEIVMNGIKRGRWSDGARWRESWKLYDDLVEQHNILGQKIDFSELKKSADDYFLRDLCVCNFEKINSEIRSGHRAVESKIRKEFGSPVKDAEGYRKKTQQWNETKEKLKTDTAKKSNLAKAYMDLASESKLILKRDYDVDIELDEQEMSRLKQIAELYDDRPVKITEELIAWTDPD